MIAVIVVLFCGTPVMIQQAEPEKLTWFVLESFPQPEKLLEEVERFRKDGGQVVKIEVKPGCKAS